MKELWAKIREALVSVLPITLLVYLIALLPRFSFNYTELISFTIGAVLLVVGIGFFNLGADIAMTPMGVQFGSGLSKQRSIGWLLTICFVLGMLITVAEPDPPPTVKRIKSKNKKATFQPFLFFILIQCNPIYFFKKGISYIKLHLTATYSIERASRQKRIKS